MNKHRNKSEVPSGLVMINRITKQSVGPIVPIHKEDWPLQELADSEVLYRYMDYWKFEDLITTSSLYFARSDAFEDPFEGRFSTGNLEGKRSKTEESFRSAYPIDDSLEKAQVRHEIHRQVVFISCWHRNCRENYQMWQAYTKTSDSVAIATSVKALRIFLPKENDIMKFAVSYKDINFPRTEFSNNSIYFYKPNQYSFEREYRLLRSPGLEEVFYSEEKEDRYRRVPINLKKIVHRVITHPKAPDETKRKVDALLKLYLPKSCRMNSALG